MTCFYLLAQGGFHATTHAVFGADVLHSLSFDNVPVVITEPLDACTQLTNTSAAAITGNVALIERGACLFDTKVLNAQNAGAVAAIIYNNRAGTLDQMNGNNDDITIPSVFIDQADGQALSAAIAAGVVTVSLHCGASHLNAEQAAVAAPVFLATVQCPRGSDRGECAACAAGQFDHDQYPASPCQPCPAGFFAAAEGATACTPCPDGQVTAQAGSAAASDCFFNITGMCHGNTISSSDARCNPGYILRSDAQTLWESEECCEQCPNGTFSRGSVVPANSDPCENTVHVTGGDPFGIQDGYTANQDCTWKVRCDSGPVRLHFTSFQTEGDWDFVNVYDGDTVAADMLSSLHGNGIPADQISSGAVLFVQMTTDGSVHANGFSATVTCNTGAFRGACEACPPGTFDHDAMPDTPCQVCEQGKFSNITGQTLCTSCPTNHSTASSGSTALTDCLPTIAGRCYQNTNASTDVVCLIPGTVLASDASTRIGTTPAECCEQCPNGTTMPAVASSGVDPCERTMYSTAGETIGITGDYSNNHICSWQVECAAGPVVLSFLSFATEAAWDL